MYTATVCGNATSVKPPAFKLTELSSKSVSHMNMIPAIATGRAIDTPEGIMSSVSIVC
jgi:hypothetical protein